MKRTLFALLAILLVGSATILSHPISISPNGPDDKGPARDESVRLTAPQLPRAFGPIHPRISPQGDSIAFSYQGAICRLSRDRGVMKRLTHDAAYDMEPAWSPDGRQIAYLHGSSFFGGELRLIRAEDGSPVDLPQPVRAQDKLFFHPDGGRILGNFLTPGKPAALAWFDLSNGSVTPVLEPPRSVRRPALSHDGQWITFATNQDVAGEQGGNDGPQADLWRVSAAGGEPAKIVAFPARVHDTYWASDGQAIYVTAEPGGAHYDIWKIPLDDPMRGARRITLGSADEDRPSASRDGRWLAYTDNREGCTALVLRDLAASSEQVLAISNIDFGKPTGSLRLEAVEKGSGEPLVARVSIQQKGGKFYAPPGSLYRIERDNAHFYCRDHIELVLPAGEYQLRAWHGPEYRMRNQEFQIEPAKTTSLTVELDRWIDASSHGWFSGENHIHANYGYGEWYNTPESMLLQCAGEDLNVCNFMVANSDGDGVFDREFFRGQPDPLSGPGTILYWNQEFRSTIWGHMTLVNLRQVVEPVFTGFKDTTNPWDIPTNADVADRTHWQNGLVNYTHASQNPADPYLGPYTAKALPIDVALGKIDSLDLNNSYTAVVPLWHRLLNCGFHIPASAGTDCFLNRIHSRLPGSDRAYVKLDGSFSYKAWIDGLRAGRSFVTNGPMLELSVDGKGLGETVQLASAQSVSVKAKVSSQFPLDRIELWYNGTVVATGKISDDGRSAVIDQPIQFDRSGWVTLSASGPSQAENPAGANYAHTSPVYVEVKGKPARAREDAEFFLAWIDRLAAAVRQRDRIPTPELKDHAEAQIAAARTVYRKITERSDQ